MYRTIDIKRASKAITEASKFYQESTGFGSKIASTSCDGCWAG